MRADTYFEFPNPAPMSRLPTFLDRLNTLPVWRKPLPAGMYIVRRRFDNAPVFESVLVDEDPDRWHYDRRD